MGLEGTHRYDDIIELPHHRSRTHPRMPMHNRAAQFMPFAALTGYEDVLREVARRVDAEHTRADTAGDSDWGA